MRACPSSTYLSTLVMFPSRQPLILPMHPAEPPALRLLRFSEEPHGVEDEMVLLGADAQEGEDDPARHSAGGRRVSVVRCSRKYSFEQNDKDPLGFHMEVCGVLPENEMVETSARALSLPKHSLGAYAEGFTRTSTWRCVPLFGGWRCKSSEATSLCVDGGEHV